MGPREPQNLTGSLETMQLGGGGGGCFCRRKKHPSLTHCPECVPHSTSLLTHRLCTRRGSFTSRHRSTEARKHSKQQGGTSHHLHSSPPTPVQARKHSKQQVGTSHHLRSCLPTSVQVARKGKQGQKTLKITGCCLKTMCMPSLLGFFRS